MFHWIRMGVLACGGLLAGAGAVVAISTWRWNRDVERAVMRLGTRSLPGAVNVPDRFHQTELESLPAPVVRYFAFALTPGQPLIRHAHLRQEGTFLMGPDTWRPFTARQHFRVNPPGLLWDASIRMAPLLPVRVRDSYLEGEGRMYGRVLGLVKVVDLRGTPEMAMATLQRYLAEAPWIPTALLPSGGITWTAMNETTARASITDGATHCSVDFHFGIQGEIVSMTTDRFRDVGGTSVLTPWEGRFWDYERVNGMRVPTRAEIGWHLPEGYVPYWRGHLFDFEYEPSLA